MVFAILGPIQLSDDMFVQDAIELLGVATSRSAARRLSSAGQVIVDYIATVALGAVPWRENFKRFFLPSDSRFHIDLTDLKKVHKLKTPREPGQS